MNTQQTIAGNAGIFGISVDWLPKTEPLTWKNDKIRLSEIGRGLVAGLLCKCGGRINAGSLLDDYGNQIMRWRCARCWRPLRIEMRQLKTKTRYRVRFVNGPTLAKNY